MPLRREAAERYASLVDSLADVAQAYARRRLAAWLAMNSWRAFDDALDEIVAEIGTASEQASSAAAELALRLLNAELIAAGADPVRELAPGGFPSARVRRSVETHRGLYEAGDEAGFASLCSRASGDAVSYAANRQMAAYRGSGAKFARVPVGGPRVCEWCVALASQGFVYGSEASAGGFARWHDNCRCKVICSADAAIEGYDQGLYLDLLRSDGRLRREGATQEERRRARDVLIAKRTCRVSPRTGGTVDYSLVPGSAFEPPSVEWRDRFVHDSLSACGFHVRPKPADAPYGFKNVDMWLDGELWEIKSPHDDAGQPEGRDKLKFIRGNFDKAYKQFHTQFDPTRGKKLGWGDAARVVLSGRYKDVPDDDMLAEVIKFLDEHNGYEVIFVDKCGSVYDLRMLPK